MKVLLTNYSGDEVEEFRSSLGALGQDLEIEHPPPAAVQLAGPAELVQISIDPQTLRLIFEYTTTLLLTGTSISLVKKFLNSVAEETGKQVGGKIVAGLAQLWHKLHRRVRTQEAGRVYLGFDFKLGGSGVTIDDSLFPTHLETLGEDEETQAFCLLFFRLMPLLDEFAEAAKRHGVTLASVSVNLMYAFGPESWHWLMTISQLGSFRMESDGILKPADLEPKLGLWFWTRRRLRKRGIAERDIDALVRRCRRMVD